MLCKLRQALSALPYDWPSTTVWAAVSGGCDSMALLHALAALQPSFGYALCAVHIHHGLRAQSDAEAALVQRTAAQYAVPCRVVHVDVPRHRQRGESVETAARRLRYAAFDAVLDAHSVLMTAHHQSDQAETVLLHLLRGAGTRGLQGILPVRGRYVRPLLGVEQQEIRAYAREHGLAYAQDASNADCAMTRNRIRHALMPQLCAYNPQIVQALCRTAQSAQEDEAALMQQVEAQKAQLGYHVLPGELIWFLQAPFAALPVALQKRLLRQAMHLFGVYDLNAAVLEAGLRAAQTGRRQQMGHGIVVCGGHHVQIGREAAPIAPVQLPLAGRVRFGAFDLLCERGVAGDGQSSRTAQRFDAQQIARGRLCARTRQAGDRIAFAHGHSKLSDRMVDHKVPSLLRDRLPVITLDDEILFVPGVDVGQLARVTPQTREQMTIRMVPAQDPTKEQSTWPTT